MGTAPWFRAAHEGQSLGEAIPVAPDEPLDAETEALLQKTYAEYWTDTRASLRQFVREVRKPVEQERDEKAEIIAACGAEMDELRAKANAAEHRRNEALYRARRIVLDAELQGENAKLLARVADLEQRGGALVGALEHVLSWPLERGEHVAMARVALDGWAKRGTR